MENREKESSVLEGENTFLSLKLPNKKIKFILGEKDKYIIGRERECDIYIPDCQQVSKRHALIIKSGKGGYQIRDLESTNGTYINKTRIGDSFCPLNNRDKIWLGDKIFLMFKQGLI